MNLKQIKDMVFSITDYNPDVTDYQNEVTRIVNEVYDDFFSGRPWTFAQKEIDMFVMPDVTITDAIITSTNPQNPQSKLVTNVNTTISAEPRYEGSILQITGAGDTSDNGEYFIDSVQGSGGVRVSKKAIYDSPAWSTTTNPVTVIAKQRYITLPPDCVTPLGISFRDPTQTTTPGYYGTVTELNRRDDAEARLWLDSTGTPSMWIPYDNVPGGELDITDFPPLPGDLAVTNVAATLGVNDWPPGDYEFFLAYRFRGNIGPIGEAVAVSIPVAGGPFRPRFTTRDTTLSNMFGLHKHIFYKIVNITATGYGDNIIRDMNAFSMTATTTATPGGGFTVGTKFYIPDTNASCDVPAVWLAGVAASEFKLRSVPRLPDFGEGTYWRIRLHPRPNFFMPVRIRYIRKPQSLIENEDTPESPPATHRYIVYRSCEELFTKHNALPQAQLYKKKADDEEKKMAAQWLTQRAASYVKRGFGIGAGEIYKPFRRLTQLP